MKYAVESVGVSSSWDLSTVSPDLAPLTEEIKVEKAPEWVWAKDGVAQQARPTRATETTKRARKSAPWEKT